MNVPNNLVYTKTHEWIKIEGNNAKIGVTDFAQHEMTDIVHVEMPEIGTQINKGQVILTMESVKSAFDIYAPLSGKIVEINDYIVSNPEIINQSPYEKGYLFIIEISDKNEFDDLLSAKIYKSLI
ncbi:MAG: glycine cleavage system protein GcvH [Endomicrobium sp.]|jgi:glycine cleavage system H protein|nr:glycine cleavage system protein GcvH [Endomicrobium sp.]